MEKTIIIVGTGQMAVDYAKILLAKKIVFQVVGRGEKSAEKFESEIGIKPFVGGLQEYLAHNVLPENTFVIIATGTEMLMSALILILEAGATKVLVEKPAAISIQELLDHEPILIPYLDKVFVAYNRRFYASVIEARRMIEEDGGLQTMHFEFTEWAHIVTPLTKATGVKENWFFANSTHVVDLAFYLGGKPTQWQTYAKSGSLDWHASTNFTGAGITDKGVLFSYLSNWESAGRWAVELLTKNRRIYLKPMEGISIQHKGTVAVVEHEFDDDLDRRFKPGLFKQVNAFLANENDLGLCNLIEQIKSSKNVYAKILNT